MTAVTPGRFFSAMAAVLLVLVLVGFSPTFYLKAFFDTRELPLYLHVHGAALTAWFALLLVQTLLVASRRVRAHRRLGRWAAAAAVLLVLVTIPLILNVESSRIERGSIAQQPLAFIVLGDFAALVGFSGLMSIGIAFRRKPSVHKRAMLLAFIALVGPALGRIGRFPVFGDAGFVVVIATQLLLLAALCAHDLVTERRIHTITACGSVGIVAVTMAATMIAQTERGAAFVHAISFD